ncbi:MAG: tetratricopeptide repeat protein [Deltaproteobacteria bacterium]|nr:tetratricopeptide repeat protein [Deltaproteobacteria bacterium]
MRVLSAGLLTLLAASAASAETPPPGPPPATTPTTYRRAQTMTLPPVRIVRPARPAARAAPDLGVGQVIAPAALRAPPKPGELARLEARTPTIAAAALPDHLLDLGSEYGRHMVAAHADLVAAEAAVASAPDAAAKTAAERDVANALNRQTTMLLKAVKTLKPVVDAPAPGFTREDEALFTYGYILHAGRYLKEARAAFDRLLKSHPTSPHVVNAHLVFAEYHLATGQLADAEARYRVVLKFPRAPVAALAHLRLAQINFDLGRFQEALEMDFQVAQDAARDPALALLVEPALRGFVDAYAKVGKADKAQPAFRRVSGARATDMLGWLAERYVAQGEHAKAHAIYGELSRLGPPDACALQVAATWAVLDDPKADTTGRTAAVEQLLRVRGKLEAAGTMPAPVAARCREDATALGRNIALAFHHEAQKTHAAEPIAAALRLYTAYVATVPDAPDLAEMRLLAAEAAWSHAERDRREVAWIAAAHAFAATVRTPDSTLATVLAWKNALGADPSFAVQAGPIDVSKLPAGTPAAGALDGRAAALVAALDAYAAQVASPDDEELVRGRFLAATLYRRANLFDRAAALLADVEPRLARRGDHANREIAANLLLDTLARARKRTEMLVAVDRFAADRTFYDQSPALRRTIEYLRTHALPR